jgi:hypothetical protein
VNTLSIYRDSFAGRSLRIGDDSFSDLYFVIGVLLSTLFVQLIIGSIFECTYVLVTIVLGSVFCDWGSLVLVYAIYYY